MALDKDLLAKVKAGFKKQAFVPAGGDPAAQGGGGQVDPNTGLPIDPSTGLPIDPNTGMPIDPNTGMPIDPSTGMPMDPSMMGGGMPPPQGGAMPPTPAGDPTAGMPPPSGGEDMSPDGEPYIKLTFSQLLAAFDKISKLAQKISGTAPAQPQAQPAPQDNGNQALANEVKDLKNMLMSALS